MASLAVYDLMVPYNGDRTLFFAFWKALMAKLSSIKLFNIFMEPEESFKRPREAFLAVNAGNPSSGQLKQIQDFKENSKKYKNDCQQCYSLIVTSLGPVPTSKVEFVDTMDVSPYKKCQMVATTLREKYCQNTPAAAGNLTAEIQEMAPPGSYKAAMDMVATIVLLNGRLQQMTGEAMSDRDLRNLLFRKLRKNQLFVGVCRRIADAVDQTFAGACDLLADDCLNFGDEVVAPTSDPHSVPMSGLISRIDGSTGNTDMRACYNCFNTGHLVKDCQSLYCHRCHAHWMSHGDPKYHKSVDCPNFSGNNSRRNDNNNSTNKWKPKDQSRQGRNGRQQFRGVVQGRTPPRVPKVNKVARQRDDDEESVADDDSDGWTPKKSKHPYKVNSVRACGNVFEPPQPFIPDSNGGSINLVRGSRVYQDPLTGRSVARGQFMPVVDDGYENNVCGMRLITPALSIQSVDVEYAFIQSPMTSMNSDSSVGLESRILAVIGSATEVLFSKCSQQREIARDVVAEETAMTSEVVLGSPGVIPQQSVGGPCMSRTGHQMQSQSRRFTHEESMPHREENSVITVYKELYEDENMMKYVVSAPPVSQPIAYPAVFHPLVVVVATDLINCQVHAPLTENKEYADKQTSGEVDLNNKINMVHADRYSRTQRKVDTLEDQLPISAYTESMVDSGANVSVCSPELVRRLSLQIFQCKVPLKLEFANRSSAYSDKYVYLGPLLGSTYILDDTNSVIVSVSQANRNGYGIYFSPDMMCHIYDRFENEICSFPIREYDQLYYLNVNYLMNIPESTARIPRPMLQGSFPGMVKVIVASSSSSKEHINKPSVVKVTIASEIVRKRINKGTRVSKETYRTVMWLHRRLGHASPTVMARGLRANAWPGVGVTAAECEEVFRKKACIICLTSKATRLPTTVGSGVPPPAIAYSISSDFVPVSTMARGGFKGYYIFRELLTAYIMVVLVKTKTYFTKAVLIVRAFFLQHGYAMHNLIVDAGKVENAAATKYALNQLGITIQAAAPECQNMNPVERSQQTLANAVCAALGDQRNLDNTFWGLAVLHCADLMNVVPNSLSGDVSPMFLVTGVHPDLDRQFLFPFGQAVIVVMLLQGRDKFRFGPTGEIGFYVGTTETANGASLVYIPSRSAHLIYVRRSLRPIELEPFESPTVHPVGTYIINEEERPILVLPDNPRLNSPGMKFIENSAGPNEQSTMESGSLMYENVVSLPSAQPILSKYSDLIPADELQSDDIVVSKTATQQLMTSAPMEMDIDLVQTPHRILTSEGEETSAEVRTLPSMEGVLGRQSISMMDNEEPHYVAEALPPSSRKSTRNKILNRRFAGKLSVVGDLLVVTDLVPRTISKVAVVRDDNNPTLGQAINGKQWVFRWHPAIKTEFETLDDMGTWVDVSENEIPPGALVYPTKIVLTSKVDAITGLVVKSKARLCVVGDALNLIYQNVFAPTANEKSLKLMFALAIAMNMVVQTVDIRGAFLYAKQKRDVYITLPIKLTNNIKRYKKLKKTLYGLPDSPQAFYDDISIYLLSHGYVRTTVDPCFFHKRVGDKFLMAVVHVDDFAIAGDSVETVNEFVSMLEKKYTLQRNVNVETFLGISIKRTKDGSVIFSQPKRIDDMIKEYNLEGVTPPSVPMSSLFKDELQDQSPRCDYTKYMQLLGKLLYMIKTRPDISYSVNRMATRAMKCTNKDFDALLRIVSYLGGTRHLGLRFRGDTKEMLAELTRLICFFDAAHATHPDSRSHIGLCFSFPGLGAMFYCASKKGLRVVLESTEAETDAAVEGTKEVIYFRQLLLELGFPQEAPTVIYADNTSMITLATDFSGNHKRVKHYITRINFLIEQVRDRVITFTHVGTQDNVADILTKPLGPIDFLRLRPRLLGM